MAEKGQGNPGMSAIAWIALVLVFVGLARPAMAQAGPEMQRGMDFVQKSMAMMTPELQEKVRALPPEIRQFLVRIAVKHDRHSNTLTLVQVMQ
ncbi:MAG: hypothetical protein Q8L69_12025, partial [Gallionellaceae bacterium]|nr:hypothetical protein [Gallionellaceae bacterium]